MFTSDNFGLRIKVKTKASRNPYKMAGIHICIYNLSSGSFVVEKKIPNLTELLYFHPLKIEINYFVPLEY